MRIHNKMDFASGSFLLVFGLFLALLSLRLAIWSRSGPEAGFFPLTIGIIIIGCSFFVLGGSIDSRRRAKNKEIQENRGTPEAAFLAPALYTTLMLVCGLLLETFGFLIASALLLLVILKYLEKQSWRMTILLGLASIIISYLLFKSLLGVPLPSGQLIPW
jgi:putative tricarboxylic transport membrane protein